MFLEIRTERDQNDDFWNDSEKIKPKIWSALNKISNVNESPLSIFIASNGWPHKCQSCPLTIQNTVNVLSDTKKKKKKLLYVNL